MVIENGGGPGPAEGLAVAGGVATAWKGPTMAGSGKIQIPGDGIPALRQIAAELSGRLQCQLNFAHAYYAIISAEQAGAIEQNLWASQPNDPQLLDTLTALLNQHPELLEQLLNHEKLNDAENLIKDVRDA
jgi:hypothetical protein